MARYLAIDWDQSHLSVLAANVGGGSVRVQKAAAWAGQEPLTTANAEAAGVKLRDLLKEAKVKAAPVVGCIGRDRVIVKEVRYPAVPKHEEPAVVRFQATKELTGAADDVVLDYVNVGEPGANGERRALVQIVRKDVLTAYQTACKAAGLKLVALAPRPYGVAACLERTAGTSVLTPAPEPAGSPAAVVVQGDGWAEFIVTRGGQLQMARTLAPGAGLAGEVKRNLAVWAGQSGGQPIRTVYVCGGPDNAGLRQKLHEMFDLPVHLLDPFTGAEQVEVPPDRRGAFAGLVGLLHLYGERAGLPVNMVRPKTPTAQADPNRSRKVLYGALAATVLFAVVGMGWYETNQLAHKVDAQLLDNAELDKMLVSYDEDARRIKALSDWNDRTVVWLDELYDMTERFPEPESNAIRLTQFSMDVVDRAPNSKSTHIAKMSLKGVTGNDYKPVDQLVSHIASDKEYRADPKKTMNNQGPDRFNYPRQWVIERIDLEKKAPEKYVREVSKAPPPGEGRPERRGR